MTRVKIGETTARIMFLEIGKSTFVTNRNGLETARKKMPDAQWKSEATDGGFIVTRLR